MNSTLDHSASAVLDDGAWVLGCSLRAREHAAALQRAARELVLTFRVHRFRPICGASDGEGDEELRRRVAAFAAHRPMKTYVVPSRGAACGTCGSRIFVGDLEYDIVAAGLELRLDAACYLLLVDERARLKPTESTARG